MATILEIKLQNNDNIRTKTLPGSITRGEDADMRDVIANELRDRGVISYTTVASLAAESKYNTKLVLIHNVGLFTWVDNTGLPAADNDIYFASADAGFYWKKIISVEPVRDKMVFDEDDEYELASGFMLHEIWLKASAADNLKIGTTDGGDEIMLTELMTVGEWKRILVTVFADGGNVTLYFRGITDDLTVYIYKKII